MSLAIMYDRNIVYFVMIDNQLAHYACLLMQTTFIYSNTGFWKAIGIRRVGLVVRSKFCYHNVLEKRTKHMSSNDV